MDTGPYAGKEWVDRCLAKMLELDPLAMPDLLLPIVEDMARSLRWSALEPEDAAEIGFGPLPRRSRT